MLNRHYFYSSHFPVFRSWLIKVYNITQTFTLFRHSMNYWNICYSLDRGQVLFKFILLILWECKQIVHPILVLFGFYPVVTLPECLNYFMCEKLVEILFVRTLSKNLFVHSCDCHVLHVIVLTGFFWFFVFFLSP